MKYGMIKTICGLAMFLKDDFLSAYIELHYYIQWYN